MSLVVQKLDISPLTHLFFPSNAETTIQHMDFRDFPKHAKEAYDLLSVS